MTVEEIHKKKILVVINRGRLALSHFSLIFHLVWFSVVFRGYINRVLGKNALMNILNISGENINRL